MTTVFLSVDGEDEPATDLQFSLPHLAYALTVPGEAAVRRALGDWGFSVTVIGPSERLVAMHDDGKTHDVRLRAEPEGLELGPIPVVFDQLIPAGGVVLFGHRPHEGDTPQWREVGREVAT